MRDSRAEFTAAQGPVATNLIELPLDELLEEQWRDIDHVLEELHNNIAGDILDDEVNGIFDDFEDTIGFVEIH